MVYEIRLKGHLSPDWSDWFGGLTISNTDEGEAVLVGELVDQAALLGVLNQIQVLNLTLIAINPLLASPTDSPLDE